MDPEIIQPELPLLAGAVAIGAVSAMIATLLLFPVIDRFVRERFRLERGGAMIVLLTISLLIGLVAGGAGFFWLRDRQVDPHEEVSATPPHFLEIASFADFPPAANQPLSHRAILTQDPP